MSWGCRIIHLNKQSDLRSDSIEKPLQFVEPRLYLKLKQELEYYNLHSYDVKSGAISNQNGIKVSLRYGENLAFVKEHFFKWETVENNSADINDFFHSAGENIKKALITDYYKMMKP